MLPGNQVTLSASVTEGEASTTSWRQTDGAGFTWLGTDCNNAHVRPTGTYHYYITDDYPYIPRCVFGTPDGSFRVRRQGANAGRAQRSAKHLVALSETAGPRRA